MENASTFVRGQIWWWDDPLIGQKENYDGKEIITGDSTVRFSRYVLIHTTMDNVGPLSVSVLPCSSKPHSVDDVLIPLQHRHNHEDLGYAMIQKTFPIRLGAKDRYICTLPQSVMLDIEVKMMKQYSPSIFEVHSEAEWKKILAKKYGYEYKDKKVRLLKKERVEKNPNPTKRTKWTEKKILEFLEDCKLGHTLAAEKYRISERTLLKYEAKWGYLLEEKAKNKNHLAPPPPFQTPTVILPGTRDTKTAISRFCNNILENYLRDKCIYKLVEGHYYGGNEIDSDTFYRKVGSSTYYTFFDVLGIMTGPNVTYPTIPILKAGDSNLPLYWFFDRIYHDSRLAYESDPKKLIESYRYYFKEDVGITSEWFDLFGRKIRHKTNLTDEGVRILVNLMMNLFAPKEDK